MFRIYFDPPTLTHSSSMISLAAKGDSALVDDGPGDSSPVKAPRKSSPGKAQRKSSPIKQSKDESTEIPKLSNLLSDGQQSWNKWWHSGSVHSSWIVASLARPCVVTGYALSRAPGDLAEEEAGRDPTVWRLSGQLASDPSDKWTTLHEVASPSPSTDFTQYSPTLRFDSLPLVGPLAAVRLEILDVRCQNCSHGHPS